MPRQTRAASATKTSKKEEEEEKSLPAKRRRTTAATTSKTTTTTTTKAEAKTPKRKAPEKKVATIKSETPKRKAASKKKKDDDDEDEDAEEPAPKKKEPRKRPARATRGKENVAQNKKKVEYIDDDFNSDSDEGEESKPKPKRRRIIPDDSGDDSDEYKPGASDESESDFDVPSDAASESEPPTDDDDDGTPVKRGGKQAPKRNFKASTGSKSNKSSTFRYGKGGKAGGGRFIVSASQMQGDEEAVPGKPGALSWPHTKYEFLLPDKIMDIKMHPRDHPEYDQKTLYVPKDFLDEQTPSLRQWWVLKSQHFDCILFFKLGKFYELYHMDAVIGVNELHTNLMRELYAYTCFPEAFYGRYSTILIERGYKVARIEQTETPEIMNARVEKMKNPSKFDKVIIREVCQKSTKGVRVYTAQDIDIPPPSSSYLLSIVEKYSIRDNSSAYGVCFIDTTIGEFYLGQFQDDRSNSRLLTLLAHYPTTHVVYERGNLTPPTMQLLNKVLPGVMKEALIKETQFWSAGKVLKFLHDEEYFRSEGEDKDDFSWPEGLAPYVNEDSDTPVHEKELAVTALGGCVSVLKEYVLDQQILAQRQFQTYVPPELAAADDQPSKKTKFATNMVLDAMTINNLRVFGNDGSLFKILDHCCTAIGKRMLREWTCRPSCQKAVIIERQRAVTELLDNPDVVKKIRKNLGNVPDLDRMLSKIHAQGNSTKMRRHPDGRAVMINHTIYAKKIINDFISVLTGLEEILNIVELLEDFTNPLIIRCVKREPEGRFPDVKELLNHFNNGFNHEDAKQEGFIIPEPGVDKDYDQVLMKLTEIEEDLDAYLAKEKKFFGAEVKFTGKYYKRFQIEVPEAAAAKKANGDYDLQGSRKGFKRYYTDGGRELLARQLAAEEEKEKTLESSTRKILGKFSEHYTTWSKVASNIAVLDCLISLAEYARTCQTCIPTVYDDTDKKGIFIDIRDGKHPCLHLENFTPNDTQIGTEDSAPLMLLTGPNMGGKSTLMRQVGLITIMAQMGCHVPASACDLTLADRIFTRLGANDDIMGGQSTFLVELSETATILQHATKYSLVLLDELGRGTSTYDGTAIAEAVVDVLTRMKCRTLFSTHYHSLVEDYKNNDNVFVAHMACKVETDDDEEVTEENVIFLYKLSEGVCPKSYGFNVARLAGIPAKITKRAYQIATKLESEVNLRHAFTALFSAKENTSIKPLLKTGIEIFQKC